MKRHDLHTHTTYSDGENTPEQLIRKAICGRLEVIGISDHGFTDKTDSLDYTTLPGYIEHLRRLKKDTRGTGVKLGLEIDVSKATGINPKNLPFDILNNLDYALFEHVEGVEGSEEGNGRCLRSVVRARRKLNIPAGLAHTNLDNVFYGRAEEAVKILGENDIFVEINLRYIPDIRFVFSNDMIKYFKKYKVRFAIGTDVHSAEHSIGDIDPAMKYILERELKVHRMVA